MSRLIQVRNDLYKKLKELKIEKKSFSDVLDDIFKKCECMEEPKNMNMSATNPTKTAADTASNPVKEYTST